MADYNPYWFDPNNLPPEVTQQQVNQMQPLMGQMPQQMLGAPQMPMTIQVPDIQYSDAMKKQARSQGFMEAGLNLLANMKPTALPQSPFSAIGQAGLAGLQSYQGNLDNKMKQALEYAKMQQPKEFNVSSGVDDFLMASQQKHGFDYVSPQGRQMAWRWFGTPQGQEAYKEWVADQSANKAVASWIPAGVDSASGDYWAFNRRDPENNGNPTYMNMRTQEKRNQPPGQLIATNLKTAAPTTIKEANFTKSAMQRLENMAKYYKPEYVGIIQGRIANPERKLTTLPPDQVKFYREFKQLNDDIIRSKEGAVIPDAMVKRLEQFMNDIKQPSGNFEAQFDSLTDYVRDQGMNLDESLTGQYISPFTEKHRKFWGNRSSLFGNRKQAPVSAAPGKTSGMIW
jgi:hypothetical protein